MKPLLCSLLLLSACASPSEPQASGAGPAQTPPPVTVPMTPPSKKPALDAVRHWGVQLTGYGQTRLNAVRTSPFELAVVDPFDDDGTPWPAIARHVLGLHHGRRGARLWRQVWSDHKLKHLPAAEVATLARAQLQQPELTIE